MVVTATDTPIVGRERGTSVLPEDLLFGSYFNSGPGTVFDYNRAGPREFDEMLERDGKAAGLEQVLTLPGRQAPRIFKPAKGDRGEAEFVEEAFTRPANAGGMTIPLDQVIAQLWSARVYRRVYFEKVFQVHEGRWVYDKIAWRPPTTCKPRLDPRTGGFRGFEQDPLRPGDEKPTIFEPQYALMHVNGKHRNPIMGWSDLEVTYWCYETRQKVRFLWYAFLESQSLPKTIVKNQDRGRAGETAKKIATLKSGGVVGIGTDDEVDTLESNGTGAAQFKEALQWLEAEAAESVLAGFTQLASAAAAGRGSLALSRDQSDFFLMASQAAASEVAATLTNYAVADLVRYNFGPRAAFPTFEFGPLSEYDSEKVIDLFRTFMTSNSPKIPHEFVEELGKRTAGFLDLDVDRVVSGLQRAAQEAKEKAEKEARSEEEARRRGAVATVAAPVAVAARAVKQRPRG